MNQSKIRNIAIIAHVDHGKTTTVDALLKQTHVFRENEAEMSKEQILDTNVLEREKGITILAKNVAIFYKDYKINIIDTPGHADFSGEVERTLGMADGAVLIVDAQEGPMPQTRFVLKKALELGLKIIVVINKIDKPFARIPEVVSKINNLFLELATNENQLDFTILYEVAKIGKVFYQPAKNLSLPADVKPLLETIIKEIPPPRNDIDKPFKMLISTLDYDPFLGRIILGRIFQGKVKIGQKVTISNFPNKTFTIEKVFLFKGLKRLEASEALAGDIVALTGIIQAKIGQTVSDFKDTISLPSAIISEPTLKILIGPNTSPFSGKEGKYSTSRQLEERLFKELETNLSLRVEKLTSGKFTVFGKGELHLAILLETLRREGFEMEVSKPEVINKKMNEVFSEPIEEVNIIVDNNYIGLITQELGKRLAKIVSMTPISEKEVEFIYQMPTRTMLGLRSHLLNNTKGTIIFSSQFLSYKPIGKILPKERKGVLIATKSGTALTYGLEIAQGRGQTFIYPGTKVYEGMIIGQNSKEDDIEINVCKGKKLTNIHSETADIAISLTPPIILSLEQALVFIEDDELLEVTPKNLRFRKKFLTSINRRRQQRLKEGKKFNY